MKSQIPRQFTEDIFHMQYPICTANFTNKISRSSWIWYNLWKLLAINFRNKIFHNSVDWSGLNIFVFKCISLHEWQVLRFTVFRLLENAFVKLPSPYHDLIINLPCRAIPNKIAQNNLSPICHKKASLHTLSGETLCPCSIGKSCGGASLNICKKVQNKTC